MEKIPMEWIDKLFNCLESFYENRWKKQFKDKNSEEISKTMWQSALYGCTHEEIRNVLLYLKYASKSPFSVPPHQLEFHRYAKGKSIPFVDYTDGKLGESKIRLEKRSNNPEIAKKALDEINSKLRFKPICST